MKAVLLSISPKWCKLIIDGKKTIEVRKSFPKTNNIDKPFKCYIYCTLNGMREQATDLSSYFKEKWFDRKGKVIGEFICDRIDEFTAEFNDVGAYEDIRLNYYDYDWEDMRDIIITSNEKENPNDCTLCKESCLSFDEIKKYIFDGTDDFFDFYGWHISDLKIYDSPKELSKFNNCTKTKFGTAHYPLKRPPQSWCYVEELKEDNEQ